MIPKKAIVLSTAAALAAAVLYYRFPADRYDFYPGCVLYRFTGYLCPGCGGQRAFSALLHGRIGPAFHYNALLPAALALVLALLVAGYLRRDAGPMTGRVKLRMAIAGCALVVLFGILRNLPFAPFAGLRP